MRAYNADVADHIGSDRYRQLLAYAQWTWREEKVCPYHGPSRRKDRLMGRASKRSARQRDRADIDRERSGAP